MRARAVIRVACSILFVSLALSARAHERRPRHPTKQERPSEAPVPVKEEPQEPQESHGPLMAPKGPVRVDFDDRLLQGQTNRLGAVYLYQRKEPSQPSLLDRRKSFRGEIRRDLLESATQ